MQRLLLQGIGAWDWEKGGVWPWPRVGWVCEHAGRLWVWGGERNSHILEIADSEADIQPDGDSISQMP